jgi:rhodanese-related sulfurtransferase
MNPASSSGLSPQQLASALAAGGCQLIDVREPVEHAEAHVSGARLIPLGRIEARCSEIDRQRPVIVMCQAGKRGQAAAEKLLKLGFNDVRNLEGGMLAWKAAGMVCAEGSRQGIPLMRQVQLVIGACVFVGSLLAVWVDPRWVYLPMFFGAGLIFAGSTGFCGLALLLAKMPWNQVSPATSVKPSCCS